MPLFIALLYSKQHCLNANIFRYETYLLFWGQASFLIIRSKSKHRQSVDFTSPLHFIAILPITRNAPLPPSPHPCPGTSLIPKYLINSRETQFKIRPTLIRRCGAEKFERPLQSGWGMGVGRGEPTDRSKGWGVDSVVSAETLISDVHLLPGAAPVV